MMGMTNSQVLEFNASVIQQFRANEGQITDGPLAGNPTLLMTMTGAKSGRQLTTPLTYHAYGDDFIVMASAGGDPKHPAWYFNLVANPAVELEVGTERFAATAEVTTGEDRAQVYASMIEAMPRFGDYQSGVDREIPIFRLSRT